MPKKKINLFVAINLLIFGLLLGTNVFWQANGNKLKADVVAVMDQEAISKNAIASTTNKTKPVLIAAATAVCGDEVVEGSEECEPPNTDTCNASCQYKDMCDIEFPEYEGETPDFLDFDFDADTEIDLPPELLAFLADPVAYFKKMIPPSEPSPMMAAITAKINAILRQVAMIKAYADYVNMKIALATAEIAKITKKVEFALANGLSVNINAILSELSSITSDTCDDVESVTEAANSMAGCGSDYAVCKEGERGAECPSVPGKYLVCNTDCSGWDSSACLIANAVNNNTPATFIASDKIPLNKNSITLKSNLDNSGTTTQNKKPARINPQNLLAGILQIPFQKEQSEKIETPCSIMIAAIASNNYSSSASSDEEVEALLDMLDAMSKSMDDVKDTVDTAAAAAEEAGNAAVEQAENDAAAEQEENEKAADDAQALADSTELTSEQPVVAIGLKNKDIDTEEKIYTDLPDVIPIRPIKGSDIADDAFVLSDDEVIIPSWNYGEIDINDTDPVDVDIISCPTTTN